jgi:hypothetical protein
MATMQEKLNLANPPKIYKLSDTLKKKSEQERFAVPARFNLGVTLFLSMPFTHLFPDFSHLLSEAFIVSLNERLTIR